MNLNKTALKMINLPNTLRFSLAFAFLILFSATPFAQENVGIGTADPDPSSILHMKTTDKGLLIPRMKKADRQAIVNPAMGLLVYDTEFTAIFQFDGVNWQEIIDMSTLPILDKIKDADNDTWIDVERFADDDRIHIRAKGTDMGFIDEQSFQFKSPGNSLIIGDSTGLADNGTNNENVFIGRKVGMTSINGFKNIFIGNHAGEFSLQGFRNLFAGYKAGQNNGSGNYNVALGSHAGIDISSGSDNVIIGDDAGQLVGEGNSNVYVGSLSGRNNADSSNNVMVGFQSGFLNSLGKENVFVGSSSGRTNNGAGNIFIGHRSGEFFFGNNNLAIDNSNTNTPLIFGNFDLDELTIHGALSIRNNYWFPEVDGMEDQVLTTDGSGVLNWVDVVGGGSGHEIQDVDSDTKIQVEEMPDEDKIRFDIMGEEAMILEENSAGMAKLVLNPATSAVIIGNGAGDVNTIGNNTLIGFNAGHSNTNGSANVFVGSGAGTNNVSGSTNTAIGTIAGGGLTDGSGNLMMGASAGLLNNGNDNIILGAAAGSFNQSGDQNIFIGTRSGQTGNNASGNIKIGYEAGSLSSISNTLFIDNSSTNSPLLYGNFATDQLEMNGWVGVNTTPNSQFHVNAPDTITAARIQVNGASKFLVNENGGVTIGANQAARTPSNGLYVDGDVNLGHFAGGADGYRLSVDGKIMCEELRVEISNDWPDYVFNPDYDLAPLYEVEKYFLAEGHLPNIPSAEVVQEEGFDTGEMIRKLLEKVEELTLHTLNQQKQIDVLVKQLKSE